MNIRFRKFLPLFAVSLLVVVYLLMAENMLIAKKVVAHFLMPSGLIWMALFACVFWSGISRALRAVFLALWILLALAGSPFVGGGLLGILEKPLYASEQVKEPLDALVVLGGGTKETPGGNPAVGANGDRVLRSATLYHEGKAKALITTGRSITEIGEDRLLSRETSEIWQSLGIPAEVIFELDRPRNTAEELVEVAALLKAHPEWKRVGICSSAWHLPRVFKEVRKQKLGLVPVPSEFRSLPLQFTPIYLIPQGRGFRDVQTACWEFLGLLI